MAVILHRQRVVVRFEGTVLRTDPFSDGGSDELNMKVFGGDLFLIRLARSDQLSAFSDACAGTNQPIRGGVFFLGRNWETLSPDHCNALRGRIGRVFYAGSWINHLSLLENILLAQLHHTRREEGEIRDEAARFAEHFGLPGAPLGVPADILEADLQRAACVRAFLGRPSLILLEEPTRGLSSELNSPLIHAIRDARNRGAAVIWLTRENAIWNDSSIPATCRYRLAGRKLMEVEV